MPLSAIVHTKNAAQTLERALESILFADEIIVIDMESTDGTLEIAHKKAHKVLNHPDVGYADPARNFGLRQAQHDWILVLDADEEVPASLKSFVQKVVAGEVKSDLQASAYYLPRKNIIFNQWLEHTGWWPDYQLRLFKKGTVTWQDGVHRLPNVSEKSVELPATEEFAILHHNYQTVDQFVARLNRYTSIKAAEVAKDTTSPNSLTAEQAMAAFGDEFIARYFAQEGRRDGLHGLSLACLQGMYELIVQLKVWEKAGFPDRVSETNSVLAVSDFDCKLRYWLADWQVKRHSGIRKIWWQLRRKYQW